MKRLPLIFLLIVLPLQMSWAAVTSYCQHENGKAAQHFGHHEHKHQTKADDTSKHKPLLTIDTDCGFCQLSCTGIPIMPSDIAPISLRQAVPISSNINFIAFLYLSRPERPKWARAV